MLLGLAAEQGQNLQSLQSSHGQQELHRFLGCLLCIFVYYCLCLDEILVEFNFMGSLFFVGQLVGDSRRRIYYIYARCAVGHNVTSEPTCTAKAKSASPVVPCREVKRAGSKAEGESYSVIFNDSSAVLQNAITDFNCLCAFCARSPCFFRICCRYPGIHRSTLHKHL